MAEKITNPKDLAALRERVKSTLALREGPKELQVTVHMGTCGIAAGARDVLSDFAEEIEKASTENVTLRQSGCVGLCDAEPMATVTGEDGKEYRYGKLDADKVRRIVAEHVVKGSPVMDYLVTT